MQMSEGKIVPFGKYKGQQIFAMSEIVVLFVDEIEGVNLSDDDFFSPA
jgi:hypothetical protein